MKRLILLLILFVNLQMVITHEDMRLFSYSTISAQHMTKEAGDNCYDEYDHLWYHVDVAFDCNDYGTVSTPCRYCLKEFGSDEQAISERDRHEYECGRTLVGCIFCGAMVQRKEMEVHYAFSCPYWRNVFNDPNSGIKSWEEYKKSMRISSGGGDSSGGTNGDYGGSYASNSSHYFYMNPNIPVGYEGALIADFCYDGKAHLEELRKAGYDPNTKDIEKQLGLLLKDSKSGLDCKLLAKKDGNKIVGYVLAFAGTDTSYTGYDPLTNSFPDVSTDILQVVSGMPPQYALALVNASILSAYCKKQKLPLAFVGHSLGGGEAALASMVTGNPAITYNPAAVSNTTIDKLKDAHFSTDTSRILQYVIKGDPIHFVNDFTGNPSQGRVIYVQNNESLLRNFLTGHFISSMIDGLKQ